jgi:hypothetical protein
MTRKIIGICGFIGCGKGTVGDILVEEYGFTKISYADRLKDTVAVMFGWDRNMIEGDTPESREWRETPDPWWTEELGYAVTPRLVMQRVGTDCMRKGLDDQVWVKFVKKTIQEHPDTSFVIPDVRFYNERALVREMGGQVWRVKRGPDPDWVQKAINDNRYDTMWMKEEHSDIHESEWRWLDYPTEFDKIIPNDTDLATLKEHVYRAIGG